MEVIEKREACLNEIIRCSQEEIDFNKSEEELAATVDQVEARLKELRHYSIRAVELVVLWRD